jgi:outer membrane lipoprotein-sorting protein
MNIFRRLPLSRLLLLCGLIVAIGVSATALASALGSSPTPPPKPLAEAIHDAITGPAIEGVSARVQLTNHLVEGASLAGGGNQAGEVASSPLLAGGSGRLWIAKDGRFRFELQAEKGDTQIVYDGHTISIYDAAQNTLYRYTPKEQGGADSTTTTTADKAHEAPSVAKIEEAITHLKQHVNVSEATPTDVGGQPAYTVRVSPKESGSLIAGAELSFDANHGVPLRAAVYSTTSTTPVIELAATEASYGPVASSVFSFTPPASAKIEEITIPEAGQASHTTASAVGKPDVTTHGQGISSIVVLQRKAKPGSSSAGALEGLPKVSINGASASELKTELGTILTFERSGVRYIVAGAVGPGAVEALARGL